MHYGKLEFYDLHNQDNKLTVLFNRSVVPPLEEKRTSTDHGYIGTSHSTDSYHLPDWKRKDAAVISVQPFESVYISLQNKERHKKAVKILVNGVNIITGKEDSSGKLHSEPRDYFVPPLEKYVDTIDKTDKDIKRRIMAPPLGSEPSATVVEFQVFETLIKPVSEPPPPPRMCAARVPHFGPPPPLVTYLEEQCVDEQYVQNQFGLDKFDNYSYSSFTVYLVNPEVWTQITRDPAPTSTINAEKYKNQNLEWTF